MLSTIWLKGAYALVALYMLFGFALIGVPAFSRFAALVCLAMPLWIVWGLYAQVVVFPKSLLFPLGCYALLFAGTLFETDFPVVFAGKLFTVWTGAICIALMVANGVKLRYVIDAFLLIAAANILAILVGYDGYERNAAVSETNFKEADMPRYSGLAGQSNLLSSLALMPLFLMVIRGKIISIERFVLITLMAVLITGYTGSRNALALLILFIILSAVFLLENKAHRMWILGLGVLGVVGWAILSSDAGFRTLIEQSPLGNLTITKRVINMSDGVDESAIERAQVWRIFGQHFFESPIFGRGPESFEPLAWAGLHAHNNFLELALDSGIVGVIVYYAMYVRVVVSTGMANLIDRLRLGSVMLVFLIADTWDINFMSRVAVCVLCISLVVATQQTRAEALD